MIKLKNLLKGHAGIMRIAYIMVIMLSLVTIMAFALHDDHKPVEPEKFTKSPSPDEPEPEPEKSAQSPDEPKKSNKKPDEP